MGNRKCCIVGCSSSNKSLERSLFEYCINSDGFGLFPFTFFMQLCRSFFLRINESRKVWIYKIKQSQTLDESRQLYVCDLHFDPSNIQRNRQKIVLRKNATPIIQYV